MPGPGRTKKAKEGKDSNEEVNSSQPPSTQPPSDPVSSDPPSGNNPTPGGASASIQHASEPGGKSQFTKDLIEALRDPGVLEGFQYVLMPTIKQYVSETLKPFQEKVEDIEVDMSMIRDDMSDLKIRNDSKIASQEKRIRDLERQSKARNVRISGLMPIQNPDSNLSKHQRHLVALNATLEEAGITNLTDDDFSEFVSINTPNQAGAGSTILIKCVSEAKRDLLFSQRFKLKNCASKIYINEDLTKWDAKIFKRARNEVKNGTLHACWTKSGLVWAKATESGKPFPILE
jgi:hypothetical protein